MPSVPQIIPADTSRLRAFLKFQMDWKVIGEQTGGAFAMVEMSGPKGAGPPLHYHVNVDEFFYVVDGTMTFKVGDEMKTIANGGFVWIPRTVVHSFLIDSTDARFLFGYVPAGVEGMFLEASDGAANPANQSIVSPPDREKFGTVIVGPGLGK